MHCFLRQLSVFPNHFALILGHYAILIIIVGCSGQSSSSLKGQLIEQRLKAVDYTLSEYRPEENIWAQSHFLATETSQVPLKEMKASQVTFLKNGPDDNEFLFIVSAGARGGEEVACTVVKAKARQDIAQFLEEFLLARLAKREEESQQKLSWKISLSNVMRKDFDEVFGQSLSDLSVLDSYVEKRIYPRGFTGEEVVSFFCAIKVSIPTSLVNDGIEQVKARVRKDYFYVPNLESQLKELRL